MIFSWSATVSTERFEIVPPVKNYCPRKFEFGEAPADERELVKALLKTDRFVVTSPNAYNQLGLGTTQLYNKRVVYNQKRHGTFPLGNRMVTFERRFNVPRQLFPEFLLVDLVNELDQLAEDQDAVLSRVRENWNRRIGRPKKRLERRGWEPSDQIRLLGESHP